MSDTDEVRRGAITAIYRKSNRELAAEVDELRALVRKMCQFCLWIKREGDNVPFSFNERQQKYSELELILVNPTVRKIMEDGGKKDD